MTFEDLYAAYIKCLRHKRRSHDAILFQSNALVSLSKMCRDVNERTYRCGKSYTFIVDYPKTREVFAADFADRVLETYIDIRLRPVIERLVSPRVHNNRIGMGCLSAINQVAEDIFEASDGYSENCWVFKRDIKAYFPSINKNTALSQLVELTNKHYHGEDKDDVLYVLSRITLNNPECNCERKSPLWKWNDLEARKSLFGSHPDFGLPIGNLLTQLIALWYTNDIDGWERENGLRTTRYVDDVVTVVRNEEKNAYLSVLSQIRRKYNELGLEMNEKKFYCQPSGHGVAFLGSHIKNGRIYLNNKTIARGLRRIERFNALTNKGLFIDEFVDVLNSYLGLMKIRTEHKNCERFVSNISHEWRKYLLLDKKRWVFSKKSEYNFKYQFLKQFNYDKRRNRRAHKRS